jgi:FlaA1/EpsC-like NDP-sugar epimerase
MRKQTLFKGFSAGKVQAAGSQAETEFPIPPKVSLSKKAKLVFDRWGRAQTPAGAMIAHCRNIARSTKKNFYLYMADICLVAVSLTLAMIFRFGIEPTLSLNGGQAGSLLCAAPLHMIISLIVFPMTGLYQSNWRYVSIGDLVSVVRGVILSLLIFVTILFAFTRLEMMPRSVFAIDFLITVPLLIATRLRSRLHEFMTPSTLQAMVSRQNLLPVLLIGAGDEADSYIRALQTDRNSQYFPVGIIDDSPDQLGMKIRGVSILGALADVGDVIRILETRNCKPRHIVFARPLSKFARQEVEKLTNLAEGLGIAVSRIKSPTELQKTHKLDEYEVRPIELTDLLERSQTALDRAAICRLIKNRKVLITGAGGSIGSELTLQVAALNPTAIILADNTELNLYNIDMELSEKFPNITRFGYLCNIREQSRVDEIFDRHCPDLVFHAAALKHVPMVEMNPSEGVLTNVIGTMNVAEAAKRIKAMAMVQVSTDKVVNSTNVMGMTKRLAELYCQALELEGEDSAHSSRFMTVRFGNVLGSSGSLIPLFQRQISNGGPVTVTHPEMTRFFMTIREAVELTLRASANGIERKLRQGEIFVLDMGKPVKIIEVAHRMIRLAGYVPEQDIKIKIIGCRPGEKLYEELFDSSESRISSGIEGVFGAISKPLDLSILRISFAELKQAAESGNLEKLFSIVADILPSYQRSGITVKKFEFESNIPTHISGLTESRPLLQS